MARNNETYQLESLLEELDEQVCALDEADNPGTSFEGLRLSVTLSYIRQLRDTLISIATCQNGMPSHQAQSVLEETGYCYHFNAERHEAIEGTRTEAWVCHDCGRIDSTRLRPFR